MSLDQLNQKLKEQNRLLDDSQYQRGFREPEAIYRLADEVGAG